MVQKSKNSKQPTDKIADVAQQCGILLMTLAVTLGMMELPNHTNNRVIVPNQANLAFAMDNGENNNPVRREREESAPHFISYSAIQRTPARSGKV